MIQRTFPSRPRHKSRAGRGSHDPAPNPALGAGLTTPPQIPRWARVSRPRPKSLTDRSPSFGVSLANTNTFEAGVCGERGRPVGRVPRRARESLPLPVSPGYRPMFRDGNRTETGRVDLGGRPPRSPTDPDVPVKEASGSSSHDFATRPAKPWTTRARGRLYRSSRRANLDHVMGLPRLRRDKRRLQIPRASSRTSRRL
jgi:hypothetical protein